MATVGREVLGSRQAFRRASVDVPEWGTVLVRELGAAEVTRVQLIAQGAVDVETRSVSSLEGVNLFQAALIVAGWIDDNGENVLTDADIPSLLAQPLRIIEPVAMRISEISGLSPKAGTNVAPVESAKNA